MILLSPFLVGGFPHRVGVRVLDVNYKNKNMNVT